MFTDAQKDASLNLLDSHFCGLFTALTDFRAGSFTEASYTGYGTRPGITFGAPAATSPVGGRQRANSVAVSFPLNTGSDQVVIGFFTNTLATGAGVTKDIGLLDSDPAVIGTAHSTGELITAPAHGLEASQRVWVLASPGALLPAGLSENVAYFVLAAGLTADDFAVSTTDGGAAVNITAKGAGQFIPHKPRTIAGGATPDFAIGSLIIQL